ncbi:MAG: iron-sulfur cluster assembly accessory protein [Hyphomicrobiaceae bacterium]
MNGTVVEQGSDTAGVRLSAAAARRIVEIVAAEPDASILRVSVEGGGCSGFQYRYDLVAMPEGDDTIIERDGAIVVVDPVSLPFLAGAEIDFVDALIGASFQIRNPNATASCGCGTSFAV